MRTSLKKGEQLLIETRHHWLVLVPSFLIVTVLTTGMFIYLPKYWYSMFVFLAYFGLRIYQRKCNLWAVTNFRIVDEEGIFSRYSKESPVDKINNVSLRQTFLGSIFGYGDIEIQTAAEAGATIYRFVNNPKELRDAISSAQEAYSVRSMRQPEVLNEKKGFAAELEQLFELRQRGVLTEEEYQRRKSKMLD
jgi:uncharacterized membrane protein YdbT with pleckstrin-like domain